MLRVRGPHAVGKSAFCAQLCCSSGAKVLASHFCSASDASTRDTHAILRSVAYQLACRFPPYCAQLLKTLCSPLAAGSGADASVMSVQLLLGSMAVIALFEALFTKPLAAVEPPSTRAVVVVIDGFDNLTPHTSNPLMQVVPTFCVLAMPEIGRKNIC